MVPAVWVVTVAFNFLSRNSDPPGVFAPSRIDLAVGYSDLRRITISHIAAGFGGIVRHVPRRVELLEEWQVLRWMALMLLGLRSNGEQDQKRDRMAHGAPHV
jgi:hypothetical protein